MRKTAIIVGLIGGLSTVGTLIAQQRAPNDPIANVAQIAVVRTYNVKDFPVWSKNGEKFDASILIALLQSRVIPGQWNDEKPMTGNNYELRKRRNRHLSISQRTLDQL